MTNCVLVVLSTDRYSDIWPPCTALHRKYWPDCPYDRILVSDTKPTEHEGFESMGAGSTGMSWSELVIRLLDQVESEYVLLLLDDYFLCDRVNTRRIEYLLETLVRMRGGCLRLYPDKTYMKRLNGYSGVGEHMKGLPYRTSLMAAFWKRSVLQQLLVPGESPWQFELYGGFRSDRLDLPFLATYDRPIPYLNVLQRGKWEPFGVRLCSREGLPIDLLRRPVASPGERLGRFKSYLIGRAIRLIPNKLRAKLRYFKHRKALREMDF